MPNLTIQTSYEAAELDEGTCLSNTLWRRKWQPTPVFLTGKIPWTEESDRHSPWGCKESDTTEQTNTYQTQQPAPCQPDI